MFRNKFAALVAAVVLSLASVAGFASTASATEVEQVVSNVNITVETRTIAGKVALAVRAENVGSSAVNIGLETPYGSKPVVSVAPGKNTYQSFNSRLTSIDPASVTVVVDDVAVSVTHVDGTTSLNLEAKNRSLNGTPAFAVNVTNTSASAVVVGFDTPHGAKSAVSVAPGVSAFQTFVVRS